MTTVDAAVNRAAAQVFDWYATVRHLAPRDRRFAKYCLLLQIVGDYLTVFAAALATYALSQSVTSAGDESWGQLLLISNFVAAFAVIAFWGFGVYEEASGSLTRREIVRLTLALAVVTMGAETVLLIHPWASFGWWMLLPGGAITLAATIAQHAFRFPLLRFAHHLGFGTRRVLIYGVEAGAELLPAFARDLRVGLHCVGIVDDDPDLIGSDLTANCNVRRTSATVLGAGSDIEQLLQNLNADELIIGDSQIPRERLVSILQHCDHSGIAVSFVPGVFLDYDQWFHFRLLDGPDEDSAVEPLGCLRVVPRQEQSISRAARVGKRAFDLVASVICLLLVSPLLAIIAILVKMDSPGPVLYCCDRVGRGGRWFKFYKFRSMVPNADDLKDELRDLNEREGLLFKIKLDPRVTRIGRVLRKYSLDELPQLWNVLLGDMSMVGPRPPSLDEYEQYSYEHRLRLSVQPGITGMWQIYGRQNARFERAMVLDLEYIRHWSVWLDLKLLLLTLPAVLRGNGC